MQLKAEELGMHGGEKYVSDRAKRFKKFNYSQGMYYKYIHRNERNGCRTLYQ
jgi:hypothetical protein